jgi:uncharacterized protein (DUF433 family)
MAFTRITVDPREMGGAPCIRHLHIPVAAIVDRVAEGHGVEDVLEEYPGLETEDVREALRYAAETLLKLQQHVREISEIVESSLRNATEQPERTFSQRWRGRFQPAERDDERYRALAKRYL